MKIFFYGGTFDPPHIGHKKIIEALLPRCDKMIIFPAKKSPFKKVYPIASNIHRINMLNLLFENNKVIIDDYEILSDQAVGANETFEFTGRLVIVDTDHLTAKCASAAAVDVVVSYLDQTR